MTLDVGGTSADIGVVRNGRPVLSSEEHVADFSGADYDRGRFQHRCGRRFDYLARSNRIIEGRATQRWCRSGSRLLRHSGR